MVRTHSLTQEARLGTGTNMGSEDPKDTIPFQTLRPCPALMSVTVPYKPWLSPPGPPRSRGVCICGGGGQIRATNFFLALAWWLLLPWELR